jgi:hypothetical protein
LTPGIVCSILVFVITSRTCPLRARGGNAEEVGHAFEKILALDRTRTSDNPVMSSKMATGFQIRKALSAPSKQKPQM